MTFKHPQTGDVKASNATLYPLPRLLGALLTQAIVDLRSDDVVKALDALCFWLSEDPPIYLDALGFSVSDPFDIVLMEVGDGEKLVGRVGVSRS